MHAADTFVTLNVANMAGRTRLVPSSVASRGLRQGFDAKPFSAFSHAESDLAEELNPETYATVHASSAVWGGVEKPRIKMEEETTRLMHFMNVR